MSETVTLGDVERLCWRLSGWRVEQRDVDALLAVVQAYAQGHMGEPGGSGGGPLWPDRGEGTTQRAAEGPTAPETTPGPTESPAGLQGAAEGAGIEGAYVLTVTRVDRPQPGRRTDTAAGCRTCRKCGKRKTLEGFNKDAHSPGGRKTACKECENERKRNARRIQRAAERVTRDKREGG